MSRHREKPDHVTNYSDQREANCDLCGLSFRFKASIKQHILKVHPETIKCSCKICSSTDILEIVNESLRAKLPFCSICNAYFCKKPIYECHMRVVHNTTGRHSCKFCPEKFSNLSQRNYHMHQVHTKPTEDEDPEGTDVGQVSTLNDDTQIIEINQNEDQSGPKFLPKLSEQGLKAVTKELKIYSEEGGEKHWRCLLCAQSFSKVKYFNLHVRRTHVLPEHQPYRCKICSAGFVRVGEFRKHTRSHSGFRPLKCRTCFKSFKQQAHLRDHMLIHSDIRKYKCELCQGRFKQRGALLAHVVKHDKLRPFKCHFCGVGYTVRGALSKHMKKYIGKQDSEGHLCHICHKSFSHYPMLLRHIHIHQAPKPFICETCNEAYACYTSLYFHKQKEKHFKPEEYETEPKRKYVRKGTEVNNAVPSEVNNAVTSMQEEEGYLERKSNGIDHVNTLTVRNDDGSENQETVEIIVKSSGIEEGTTAFEVDTHTDEELLSIAKQLTEMSTYPGHETYTDGEEQRKIEEEEKIMMTMLDADDEVKVNLERHLMMSKIDNERNPRESSTKVENTYVQILQYVDENGVTIENVDENGIPVEHVVETHVPVSINESTVHIQHVDEHGIQIQHASENDVPIQYVDENGVRIQHVYVDEHGNPIEEGIPVNISNGSGAQSVSETNIQNIDESEATVSQGNQSDTDKTELKVTYHVVEDENGLRILNLDTDKIQSSTEVEMSIDNEISSPTKGYEDHVVIAEGKIVERSGFPSDKLETEVQLPQAETNEVQSKETTILCSLDESSNIQVSDEIQTGQQDNQMESVNQEGIELEQSAPVPEPDRQTFVIKYEDEGVLSERYGDTHDVTETGEGESVEILNAAVVAEEKPVVYSSELAKALTEDNFNVSYSQSKQNMKAKTAASLNESKENQAADSSSTEPPIKDQRNEDIQEIVSSDIAADKAELHEKQIMLQSYDEVQDVVSSVSGNVESTLFSNVKAQLHEQQIVTQSYEEIKYGTSSNVQNVHMSYEGVQEIASSSIGNDGQLHEQQIVSQSFEQIQEAASSTSDNVKVQLQVELIPQSYEEIQEFASTVDENPETVLKDLPVTEQYYDSHNVSDVNPDQNQNAGNEKIDLNGLTLMDMSEYTPPPEVGNSALLFKKADGSLVYICVGEEQAGNIAVTESSKEIQSSNTYKEEQDARDHSTLEAAENLQSLAETNFLKVSNLDHQIQSAECIQLYGNLDTAEIGPGHPLFEAVNNGKPLFEAVNNGKIDNLGMARNMVKPDGSIALCIVYECPLCKLQLKTKKNLRDHLKRHNSMEERQFGCSQCSKRFVTRTELERHTRIHSNARPCVCNVCGKRFRQPGHLASHRRLHTGEKPYKCDQCGAKFTTNSLLKTHLLVHSDERNFECTTCQLKFKAMKDLKRHRAVHSGIVGRMKKMLSKTNPEGDSEKKAVCHKCGKTFRNKYTLKTHLETEENLREYKCDDCGFACNSKSGLHAHRHTHKTKDLEVCKICGKSFKRVEYLNQHMKVKHRDTEGASGGQAQSLYPCPACNKQFNHRGALYYHIGVSPDCMAKGEAESGSDLKDEILNNHTDSQSINEEKDTSVEEKQQDACINDNFEQVAIYNVEINDDYDSDRSVKNIGLHSNQSSTLTVIQKEGIDVENEGDDSKELDEELSKKMCTKIIVMAKNEK